MVNPIGFEQRGDLVAGRAAPRSGAAPGRSGTLNANGSGTSPRTSSDAVARPASPGTLSASSWMKRLTEASMPHGSQPRSKRAEASVRSPSRLEVRAMAMGVK